MISIETARYLLSLLIVGLLLFNAGIVVALILRKRR